MSEVVTPEVKPRTIDDVGQEYSQLLAQAGEKQFIVEVLKAETLKINQRLLELKQEANQLQPSQVVDGKPE